MSVDDVQVAFPLFQEGRGGAVPTSTHQLKFMPINHETASKFVIKNHYKHKAGSSGFQYGAYYDGLLSGVCCFGKLASNTATFGVAGKDKAKFVWELNRLVLSDDMPKNSESRFIGWCLRQLPKDSIIVSYADTAEGHTGTIYRATNWIYTGLTKERTDIDTGNKHSRHYDKETVDYSVRKIRSAKHRFVYFKNPSDRSSLKWKEEEYGTSK